MNKGFSRTQSSSSISCYQECPRKFYYRYVRKIRAAVTSVNLIFGGAVHAAAEVFLKAVAVGNQIDHDDLMEAYTREWDKRAEHEEISYSTTMNPEDTEPTAARILELFPQEWEKTGLRVLVDPQGNPMVEQHFKMDSPYSAQAYIDVIALTPADEVAVIDLKTPSTPIQEDLVEDFTSVSPQLKDYEIAVRENPERLGGRKVQKVGFMELIKRRIPKGKGKGPQVLPPTLVPAHTDRELNERVAEVQWVNWDIAEGKFFKRPMAAYNTPCGMCEYRGYCARGDTEGLVIPEEKQSLAA